MGSEFNNVADLLSSVSDDKEFNKSVTEEIDAKQLSKTLFAMRCHSGLSQANVAEKMKCTQGKVSKLENSYDKDISIGDLVDYCSAVNMHVELGFLDNKMNMVDSIKYHFFRLKNNLDNLIEISKGDAKMERGAEKFTQEAFSNIFMGLIESLKKASPKKFKKAPLQIDTPVTIEEFEGVVDSK